MPTKRSWMLIILAVGLYMLANQTQVGWVYLMSNMITGLLLATFIVSMGSLKSIRIDRAFQNLSPQSGRNNGDSFHEDDPVEVSLQVAQQRFKPAFLINGQENCPFAPPAEQKQSLFISALFKYRPLELQYRTTCDRRGLYTFPPLRLRSGGPFGFFHSRRKLDTPGEMLIYPQFHPLKQIRLLENRGFADRQVMRVGAGNEVIGTREYRSGDSLRHVHWRTTARFGSLVVKEFSDENQLTMNVVLDLSKEGSLGRGKYSTFETALRLAASFGYYANHRRLPFRLFGRSQRWQPPTTALSWWATLNYLAKVQNDGQDSLAEVLRQLPPLPFAVVLAGNPTEAISRELASLHRRGTRVLAFFITPGGEEVPMEGVSQREGLEIRGVNPYNWSEILEEL